MVDPKPGLPWSFDRLSIAASGQRGKGLSRKAAAWIRSVQTFRVTPDVFSSQSFNRRQKQPAPNLWWQRKNWNGLPSNESQQVLNPTPLKPTPLNPTPATWHKRKRKLRCSFRKAALQKLHCNIRFSAVQKSFLPNAACNERKTALQH